MYYYYTLIRIQLLITKRILTVANLLLFLQVQKVFRLFSDLPKNKSNRIVSILGLFELSVGDSPRADGISELAAARLAVDHVNKRGLLPGYKLHLITNDTKVSN